MSRARGAKAQRRQQQNHPVENLIDFHQVTRTQPKPIELIPKTLGQERLVLKLLDENTNIVITAGPAGTGKTYLAVQAGIRALRARKIERLVLTRPAVAVEDERHGFLPGDLVSKMEPWTRPILDVLREYYHPREIVKMIEDQVIEISPLAYMRGRTFKNSWVIADEMQNATPEQCKMLMTRIGVNSKIVLTGDVEQTDRPGPKNGLLDLCARLEQKDIAGLAVCRLESRDIQRHHLIGKILELYR